MRYYTFFLICCLGVGWTGRVCAQREGGAPGILAMGADSLASLEARITAKGKGGASAPDYVALGDAYLRAGDLKQAEDAYKNALDVDKQCVEAQYGLAYISFKEAAGRGLKAVFSHRRAFGTVRQLVETAPQFAPGHLLYGLCYEWLRGDYERAIFYYDRYLKMRPDDPEGLVALGRACIETKKYKRIEDLVLPYADRHPEEHRLLPIVGQYFLAHGRSGEAIENFERYVEALEPAERALYEDIRPVASKGELEEYQGLSEGERPAFLKRFWAKRDADILTEVNEGLIEHYRRVWYARSYFGRLVKPWDRRGEVYIRYGEPDYRARSNRREAYQSPAVQRVKERLAHVLYGTESMEEVYVGPVFPVRSGRFSMPALQEQEIDVAQIPVILDRPGEQLDPLALPTDPSAVSAGDVNSPAGSADATQTMKNTTYAPVTLRNDQSLVGWESWVYVNIAGGIEITFTDEMGNGNYDFAPMPTTDFKDLSDQKTLSQTARLLEYAPRTMLDRAMAAAPDEYRVAREGLDLGFYYATADFRGTEGDTRVEVAYGLPTKDLAPFAGGDTMGVLVERAVALASKDRANVYRAHDQTVLQGRGLFKKNKGEFIPDLVRLSVPPGDYQLAVQITDKVSGRTGLYKQDLQVKPYGTDRLQISDVFMAFAILDSASASQFRKGNVYVLPMPSRTYGEGQSAAAYYEVYNLKKDAQGHTRYKVEYSIRAEVEEGYGILGKTASGFQKLFGGSKPQVSVTYERAGMEESDAGYFELNLKRAKPGINRLRVTVTDLVSQEKAERETIFRYGGK